MKRVKRTVPGDRTHSVVNRIREQIATGQLSPGECIPSERDLGKILGVSRVTVRRGLDQLVSDRLLRREAGRGYFLRDASSPDGYASGSPAPSARNGAIVFVHNHPEEALTAGTYHARMWAGAREEAARSGSLIMISSIRERTLTPAHAAELGRIASGVLCDYVDDEAIRNVLQTGVTVVQIDYYRGGLPVDAIVQDDVGGIAAAVDHLYSRGHRRIGYLDTTAQLRAAGRARNAENRAAGFWMSCQRLGLDHGRVAEASFEPFDGAPGAATLIDGGVTALVLPHGELWPSVRAVLARKSRGASNDFGVVVWGDPPADNSGDFPTSVTWSKEQMGREGVRRLLLRQERPTLEPATVVIPTQLADRGTGGRGPGQ